MQRLQWSEEQRATAVALLQEVGPAEAARRTGISRGTISSWASRAGVGCGTATAAAVAATEHRVATIAERKAKLAEALMGDAEAMRRDNRRLDALDRKRNVEAVAKAIETVQLLTGEATARIEQLGGGSTVEAARATLADVKERHLKVAG